MDGKHGKVSSQIVMYVLRRKQPININQLKQIPKESKIVSLGPMFCNMAFIPVFRSHVELRFLMTGMNRYTKGRPAVNVDPILNQFEIYKHVEQKTRQKPIKKT